MAPSVPVLRHYYEVMDDRAATLKELAVIFEEVGSEHALIGGIAAGYHGRLRATIDVDFLVPGKKLKPLAEALEGRGYRVGRHLPDMIRVFPVSSSADVESVADLVSKDANPVLKAAFDAVEPADVLGQRVNVVRRGAFVALKFHAAVSARRALEDRYQDLVDIGRVVKTRFEAADAELARAIAGHMYPGAPAELDKVIADLMANRPVRL